MFCIRQSIAFWAVNVSRFAIVLYLICTTLYTLSLCRRTHDDSSANFKQYYFPTTFYSSLELSPTRLLLAAKNITIMEVKKKIETNSREREKMWRKKNRIFIYKTDEHERYIFFLLPEFLACFFFSVVFFLFSMLFFFISYVHSLRGTETERRRTRRRFLCCWRVRGRGGGGERRRNEKRFRKERKEEGSRRERTSWTRRNSAQEKKTYMRITTPQHSIYLTYPKYGSCQPTE